MRKIEQNECSEYNSQGQEGHFQTTEKDGSEQAAVPDEIRIGKLSRLSASLGEYRKGECRGH
jgi:hypothetical protein